jgi:hypothetical protein
MAAPGKADVARTPALDQGGLAATPAGGLGDAGIKPLQRRIRVAP